MRRQPLVTVVFVAVLVGQGDPATTRQVAPAVVAEWTIAERFGVAHPDQIIDFDLARKIDPDNSYMIGPDGKETVYQLLDGGRRVAVRTDLPAGARKTWKLLEGRPPAAATPHVKVEEKEGCIEITNELTGVRVPSGPGAAKADAVPAPVQGVRLRDGTWAASGPNRMKFAGKVTKMGVRFLEKGPLKALVEVAYEVNRDEVAYAHGHVGGVDLAAGTLVLEPGNYLERVRTPDLILRFDVGGGALPTPLRRDRTYYATRVGPDTYRLAESREGPALKLGSRLSGKIGLWAVVPAGPAFCRTILAVDAGQPSILLEQDTDVGASYALDFGAVRLDQARYRGHHSSSKEAGYEQGGGVYRASHARPNLDAFLDLPFDRNYSSGGGTNFADATIRRMAVWDPWVFDSGWYWQAYDTKGAAGSNVVGIFAGRASRGLWTSNSGPGFTTRSANSGGPAVGVDVQMNVDDNYPHVRFQWGLFTGSKGKDLAPPDQVQPIARQMNLHAGINLNKVHRLVVDFADPPNGYGSMYMPRAAVEKMIEKLRKDPESQRGQGYHRYLTQADPAAHDLIEMWGDASGEKVKAVVNGIEEEARSLLHTMVNDDGIYNFHWQYWMGGLRMNSKLFWIDQVLGSKAATPEMKARVKAAAVLFAAVLWDNDFVPMGENQGVSFNLGTPNMPVMQVGFRNQYALFLARHPRMRGRLEEGVKQTGDILAHDINEFGAHMACVHYVEAGMGPTLNLMQQLKMAGVKDFFRDEPRVAKFAEFYMNCSTPPEVRFGGRRMNISVGDGPTETSPFLGQMATGFADVAPALSTRLMGLWQAQGKPHGSFHGTTLLKIDEDLPSRPPRLASANFPGQFSVLRSGGGTPRETAVWLVNGNHYWDHGHIDQGEVVLYALGAPVSIDWGSTYSPRVAGALYHSLALPEHALKHPWGQDKPPLDTGAWGTYGGTKTKQDEFHAAAEGGWVRASMKAPSGTYTWTRAVSLARLADDLSVIAIQDSYTGEGAAGAKVFTLNLMADGPVETPEGNVTPPQRTSPELASAGNVVTLKPGVSRLGFTGQTWKAHPTQGIDFSLYVVADEEQQAQVGNWAHTSTGNGSGDFRQANGRDFEERQHILRLRGPSGFRAFLVAYPKGHRPEDIQVRKEGTQVVLSAAGRTVRFSADGTYAPPVATGEAPESPTP